MTHLSALLPALGLACLSGCHRADSADLSPGAARPLQAAAITPFDRPKQRVTLSTGITMTYVEAGNRGGPVVILVHGFTDTSRSFLPTIDVLEQGNTNLHLQALDARGHGGSSMPQDAGCAAAPEQCFEAEDFAADVLAFMYRKGIRKAHIVAHSIGSTRYFFKTYGKQPLPDSGAQETDLGHNTQWGAPEAVAADMGAWVTTGKPTPDLPYADRADVRQVALARGEAPLVERVPAESCARAKEQNQAQHPAAPDPS